MSASDTPRTGQAAQHLSLRIGYVGSSHEPEIYPDKPPFSASVSDSVTLKRFARVYADTKDEAKANASLVVRAVSSHEAFISLASLVQIAETDDGFHSACFDLPRLESIVEQARAALQLAKEGQQ